MTRLNVPDGEPGKRRYGAWAGNAAGYKEDKTKCVVEVPRGNLFSQCYRNRGHGPRGDLCPQHAKIEADHEQRQRDAQP